LEGRTGPHLAELRDRRGLRLTHRGGSLHQPGPLLCDPSGEAINFNYIFLMFFLTIFRSFRGSANYRHLRDDAPVCE
jgi:hypothetical protein